MCFTYLILFSLHVPNYACLSGVTGFPDCTVDVGRFTATIVAVSFVTGSISAISAAATFSSVAKALIYARDMMRLVQL